MLIIRAVYELPVTCQSREYQHQRNGDGGADSGWIPIWMTIPEAARACSELIQCGCKSGRGCISCKCKKAGLNALASVLVIVKFNCYHKLNTENEIFFNF